MGTQFEKCVTVNAQQASANDMSHMYLSYMYTTCKLHVAHVHILSHHNYHTTQLQAFSVILANA